MQHFKCDILSRGLESIQDLLLIGRFGIYHHIGTSIWEITQLCMRLCIEQGLHKPPVTSRTLLQEQLERRVFWECYVIDRYSSITLDRPLAIADRDIRVLLPVDIDDEDLDAAQSVSSLDVFTTGPGHSELTVFFTSVRHRQITSKIHSRLRLSPSTERSSITASGRIYIDLYQLLDELDSWRETVPAFDHPQCVYETKDWSDLRWMRERLLLVRKAMDLVPKRGNSPPADLVSLCLDNAIQVIAIFCRLYSSKQITYTRSYFQTLFTAGLSVIFCLSGQAGTENRGMDALAQCQHALKQLGHDLPDAVQYVAIYEALYRHLQSTASSTVDYLPGPDSNWPSPPTSLPAIDAPDDSTLYSALFWDDAVWNMEAGLGEYAYGNPHDISLWDDGAFSF